MVELHFDACVTSYLFRKTWADHTVDHYHLKEKAQRSWVQIRVWFSQRLVLCELCYDPPLFPGSDLIGRKPTLWCKRMSFWCHLVHPKGSAEKYATQRWLWWTEAGRGISSAGHVFFEDRTNAYVSKAMFSCMCSGRKGWNIHKQTSLCIQSNESEWKKPCTIKDWFQDVEGNKRKRGRGWGL